MKKYKVIASVYKNEDDYFKGHLWHVALELPETSKPLLIEANSEIEAKNQYIQSAEFEEFFQMVEKAHLLILDKNNR